jgi:hypothetical protein
VRPLIEQSYRPFEVESLTNVEKPDNIEDLMTSAEIIGKKDDRKEGVVEVNNIF